MKINNDISLYNQLESALVSNDLGEMKLFISQGADVYRNNNYLLILAVEKKLYQIVEYLISETYIDPNIRDSTPLKYAAKNNDLNMIKILIDNGADIHFDTNHIFKTSSSVVQKFLLDNKYQNPDVILAEGGLYQSTINWINNYKNNLTKEKDAHPFFEKSSRKEELKSKMRKML